MFDDIAVMDMNIILLFPHRIIERWLHIHGSLSIIFLLKLKNKHWNMRKIKRFNDLTSKSW